MRREIVSTDAAPAAIGPYAQAVIVGDMVYCSGQIALDPATGELVGAGNAARQARQVMDNLSAVLRAAGSSPAMLVKTTIYLASIGDFGAVNEVYGSYLKPPLPARATVEVAALPKGALVEIDAVAMVGA